MYIFFFFLCCEAPETPHKHEDEPYIYIYTYICGPPQPGVEVNPSEGGSGRPIGIWGRGGRPPTIYL